MWNALLGVAAMLLAASVSTAGTVRTTNTHAPLPQLSLHVSMQGDVPIVMLQRAQREVLWIFEQAGVHVEWTGCGLDRRDPDIQAGPYAVVINMVIVSRKSKALSAIPPGVLGAVVRDSDSREVGWVFFHRIERASDSFALDTGVVLGHAIAHEVGHLLLSRGTHGPSGLMRATWRMEDLRDASQGHLGFSPTEAAIIRARLAAGN
jgi:hypothetical protein